MKKIINKIFNMSPQYTIITLATFLILIAMITNESIKITDMLVVLIISVLIILQIRLGSVVFKTTISWLIIIYVTSMYTYLVINTYGYITQPFLLSISSVTIFLAQTYTKSYNSGIRSRNLWGSILAILLISFKSAIIFNGNGFWLAEVIGLNLLIIYIFAWKIWIDNSNKTKIIEPDIIEKYDIGNYKYIYIKDKLDAVNNLWINNDESKNAYPWIYSEVMRAHEENLICILISKSDTSEVYDVEKINVNMSKKIPYLYMEAKDEHYIDEILMRFEEELTLTNK